MPRPAVVKAVADPEPGMETPAGRIVRVDYEGHAYMFDADEVTIEALEDFDDKRYIRAVRSILGDEQWAEYKRRHPKAVDIDRFLSALLAAAGAVGNPSASSAS